MKNQIIISVFVITTIISFTACKKDATIKPKDYPYIITNEVTDIDSTGATFNAEIIDLGQEEIIEYGFVWSEKNNPTIADYKKIIGHDYKKGSY